MLWFRCILVGLVTVLVVLFICLFGGLAWLMLSSPAHPGGGEVGWDIVTMWHNGGINPLLITFAAATFAIGFLLAFRTYSRLRANRSGSSR